MEVNSNKPRVLTGAELERLGKKEWVQKSWGARSLLLTIEQLRAEASENELQWKLKLGQALSKLQWFEHTYSTMALAPLIKVKRQGIKCPHCQKNGAAHIGNNWCCFECHWTWKEDDLKKLGEAVQEIVKEQPVQAEEPW